MWLKVVTVLEGRKEHLTVALCVSASGEIEKPLVIGKSLKPRCFKQEVATFLSVHTLVHSAQ